MDWQPIETAPKKTPPVAILVAGGDLHRPTIVWWSERFKSWGNNWRRPYPYNFTVWMPLPPSPSQGAPDNG